MTQKRILFVFNITFCNNLLKPGKKYFQEVYKHVGNSKEKAMNVIPTAAGRRINTYPPQQNPSFGRAIVIKSKDSKLLEMLEHIDFLFWSEKNPKCKYKGNVCHGKSKYGFFKGLLTDDTEANTLHKFANAIKDAFLNNNDIEYDRLAQEESIFLSKIKRKAHNAKDVIEIKSVKDLLDLPMLQEDRVQIEACLKIFPENAIN